MDSDYYTSHRNSYNNRPYAPLLLYTGILPYGSCSQKLNWNHGLSISTIYFDASYRYLKALDNLVLAALGKDMNCLLVKGFLVVILRRELFLYVLLRAIVFSFIIQNLYNRPSKTDKGHKRIDHFTDLLEKGFFPFVIPPIRHPWNLFS